jgi:putative Holliday junction resolvase
MRALGVDYGTVKVGLALSDELKILASPYKVIPSTASLAEDVAAIVEENGVDLIVVGMPYYDGAETGTTAKVRAFTERLRTLVAVPIYFWDESFSTRFARSRMIDAGVRKKKRTARGTSDTWAAAIILQEFLDNRAIEPPQTVARRAFPHDPCGCRLTLFCSFRGISARQSGRPPTRCFMSFWGAPSCCLRR